MCAAFRDGTDIHTSTAATVFGVAPEEVTLEMRKKAKAVNFGIVYGIGAYSLAQDIGVTRAEAQRYIDGYFATYPDIKNYMDSAVEQAKEQGFSKTLFGRRRYLPELKSSNGMLRAFGERVARNMPIQGTAADIIKLAMIRTRDKLLESGLNARVILQVHDELILNVKPNEEDKVISLVKEEMYVERLAERLDLTPATISFHLKKLEDAGAVTSSELKDQLDELQSQKDAITAQIKDLEKQQSANRENMEDIMQQKAVIEQQIALLQDEIIHIRGPLVYLRFLAGAVAAGRNRPHIQLLQALLHGIDTDLDFLGFGDICRTVREHLIQHAGNGCPVVVLGGYILIVIGLLAVFVRAAVDIHAHTVGQYVVKEYIHLDYGVFAHVFRQSGDKDGILLGLAPQSQGCRVLIVCLIGIGYQPCILVGISFTAIHEDVQLHLLHRRRGIRAGSFRIIGQVRYRATAAKQHAPKQKPGNYPQK